MGHSCADLPTRATKLAADCSVSGLFCRRGRCSRTKCCAARACCDPFEAPFRVESDCARVELDFSPAIIGLTRKTLRFVDPRSDHAAPALHHSAASPRTTPSHQGQTPEASL